MPLKQISEQDTPRARNTAGAPVQRVGWAALADAETRDWKLYGKLLQINNTASPTISKR